LRSAAITAVKKLLTELPHLSKRAEAVANAYLDRIVGVEVVYDADNAVQARNSSNTIQHKDIGAQGDVEMTDVTSVEQAEALTSVSTDLTEPIDDRSRWTEAEVVRHLELYFALCSRDHAQLRR
jgi:hypothetical protein